ncbi:hypothetical protein UPYG_G00106300 [Umbra pygmaea]|uniref:Uncharacterized protein n=1 Tax=Umbra pygmaea TaxID=75934 RepID=A0ABD0XJM7_UMBPY
MRCWKLAKNPRTSSLKMIQLPTVCCRRQTSAWFVRAQVTLVPSLLLKRIEAERKRNSDFLGALRSMMMKIRPSCNVDTSSETSTCS